MQIEIEKIKRDIENCETRIRIENICIENLMKRLQYIEINGKLWPKSKGLNKKE